MGAASSSCALEDVTPYSIFNTVLLMEFDNGVELGVNVSAQLTSSGTWILRVQRMVLGGDGRKLVKVSEKDDA